MQKELAIDPGTLQILINEKTMVRMLTIMVAASSKEEKGISTRRLLQGLGANGLHPLLTKAEKRGYIKRVKVKKPKGQKGNDMVVNYLTPTGLKIVKTAKVMGLLL